MNRQRVPLRVPSGWKDQEKSLIIQIENALDEIYRKLGDLEQKVKELQEEET